MSKFGVFKIRTGHKTTEKYVYEKGEVKLDFSLNSLKQHKDFLPLLKQGVIDVEKKIEELKNNQ